MASGNARELQRSRWSQQTNRVIDLLCLLVLIAVVATVIYGFALRAVWAHGYYIAVLLSVMGALAMIIGLAQQAIAARDADTWHNMAMWQVRAARVKIAAIADAETLARNVAPSDEDSPDYYEHLIRLLMENMQHDDEEALGK